MNAEIITIGDELLIGQTIDTNSVYLAKKFEEIGIRISRKTAISDEKSDIIEMLQSASQRVDLIIITGGLGPTKDDITKKTLVDYFQCGWRIDQNVIDHLSRIFQSRGREFLEINKVQADLPACCETLHNEVGTAPGMLFNEKGKIIISLPGVPNEVEYIIENQAIPRIIEKFNLAKIEHRTLITLMVPESMLSKQLEPFEASLPENLKLAYLPSFNCVKLRLSANANENIVSSAYLDEWFLKFQVATHPHVFCTSDISPVSFISRLLIERNISLSTSESCTGGFIANQFIQTPGISKIVSGSIITYSNEAKESQLNVPHEILLEFGAVSEETAIAMVNGVCAKFNSMLGIATTGIAGPSGGTDKKPVGTIFIAVKYGHQILVRKFRLFGNRIQFMERANNCAMAMVKEILENI